MKARILLNFLFLLPVIAFSNTAENISLPYEETRTIKKSFAVGASASVEIINKYGDIQVETWNKDSVRFEVVITAKASKLSTAKELFEMADVKFSGGSVVVLASLVWGENVNAFKRGSVEMTLAAGSSQELRVDYKVYLPGSSVLKIENRFGDVFLPDMNGKTYISLWHGNLRGDKIKNAKSIEVKYGDVKLKEVTDGDCEVSFGDIEIETAVDLFIHATSGTIEIENAGKLHVEGTNEKVRIENAEDVTLDLMLSDVRIRKLSKKLNGVIKMGDITVDRVTVSFTSMDIHGTNGEINLGFDSATSFLFEANLEKSKAFHAAENFVIIDDDKMESTRMIEGKKGESTLKKLNIQAKSCSVYLNQAD